MHNTLNNDDLPITGNLFLNTPELKEIAYTA